VSDPILGLTMLGLIVAAIMMGFPTAFTMMGLGMFFGFIAFFDPSRSPSSTTAPSTSWCSAPTAR
jgi:TRAP-type mannitol/chloroaromatic compound transport system permease large subunit